MTIIWIAVLIAAAGVVLAVAVVRRLQLSGESLGSMSDEWVASQRANEPYRGH